MTSQPTYVFTLLITLFLLTCSPDSTTNNPEEDTNEFVFNGVAYNLVSAIVTDENSSSVESSTIGINLFNKTSTEITGNGDLSGVSYVYFDINDVTIQNTTYSQINDYDISVNSSIVDSEFNPGTIILSDDDPDSDEFAQSGSITVINFTEFNLKFTFTFTRNDGQMISGSYDGNYLAP